MQSLNSCGLTNWAMGRWLFLACHSYSNMYVSKDVGVQLCVEISCTLWAYCIVILYLRRPLLRTRVVKQINRVLVKVIHLHTVHSSVKERVMSFDVIINNMQHVCVPGDQRLVNSSAWFTHKLSNEVSKERERELVLLILKLETKPTYDRITKQQRDRIPQLTAPG